MLPARSKRYAPEDGEIARLELTTPWHLLGTAFMVLGVLTLIFPRGSLIDMLYQERDIDTLALSYIHNLYRADPNNPDAGLFLARTMRSKWSLQEMEAALTPSTIYGTSRQRVEASLLLFELYTNAPDEARISKTEKMRRDRALIELIKRGAEDTFLPKATLLYAAKALELHQPALALLYLQKSHATHSVPLLEEWANAALGEGRHKAAATFFLFARVQASSVEEARYFFQKGINAYMQASHFDLAMESAKEHLDDLEQDLPTLRYLSQVALSAGKPLLAAEYARLLVFTVAERTENIEKTEKDEN
jgi:hypothetical protein